MVTEYGENTSPIVRNDLFGRLDIYSTFDAITPDNIVEELNSALTYHVQNMLQEEFLYWYRRGVQPILNRRKEVREDILNKVQENHADEFTAFKNGYFLTQPAYYVARKRGKQRVLKELNEYLYRSGKHEADNKTVDWFHMVGKGVTYVEPSEEEGVPFKAYALDPRCAFVAVSSDPSARPVYGGYMVKEGDEIRVSLWDDRHVLGLHSDDGCLALGRYLMPVNLL